MNDDRDRDDRDGAPPLSKITLTIELTREADLSNEWTSRCVETDTISGGLTPQSAVAAVAEAIGMMVDHDMARLDLDGERALRGIMIRVANRDHPKMSSCPRCKNVSVRADPYSGVSCRTPGCGYWFCY